MRPEAPCDLVFQSLKTNGPMSLFLLEDQCAVKSEAAILDRGLKLSSLVIPNLASASVVLHLQIV